MSAAEYGDRGMSVRGMANIPLTLIPLNMRSWQTSGWSVVIALRSPLVAAPPRHAFALKVSYGYG
jgi:hypothetical protein